METNVPRLFGGTDALNASDRSNVHLRYLSPFLFIPEVIPWLATGGSTLVLVSSRLKKGKEATLGDLGALERPVWTLPAAAP